MKVGFDKGYKGFSIYDVDQFSLDKDQIARICCVDPEIEMSWAHWLNFGENDRRSGYYKCHGRYEVIFGTPGSNKPGQGSDPEKCLSCAKQLRNGAVGLVARRFATNIMRYLTDNKGNVRNPLMADCVVWRFGDDKYNRLVDIKEQYGDKDHGIRILDMVVKCTVKQYQRFDIDPLRECLWRTNGDVYAKQFMDTWKQNRQPTLEDLLGIMTDAANLEKLISEAMGTPMPQGAGGVAGGQAPVASPQDLQRLLDDSGPRPTGQMGHVPGATFPTNGPPLLPGFAVPLQQPQQQPPQQFQQQMPPPLPSNVTTMPLPTSGHAAIPTPNFVSSQPVQTVQRPVPVVEQPGRVPTLAPPPQNASPIPPPPLETVSAQPPAQAQGPAPTMPPTSSFDDLLKI